MSLKPHMKHLARAGIALALLTGPVATAEEAGTSQPTTSAGPEAGLKKAVETLEGDVKKLKGLKISGFVHARFELDQASKDGIADDGKTAATRDQFSLRRARLKAAWQGTRWSEVALQLEAIGKTLSLIDAEVSLIAPWKPLDGRIRLTAGQTLIPFGFDILQPMTQLEMPERSIVVNRLFPGNRDRGVKLQAELGPIRAMAGIFNGNGIDDTSTTFDYQVDKDGDGVISAEEEAKKTSAALNFGNNDRDGRKDFAGRLGVDFGFLAGGVSAYFGQWGRVPLLVATTDPTTGVTTYSGGDELEYLEKSRLGADVELELGLVKPLGRTTVRIEYVQGHGIFAGSRQDDTDVRGGYVMLVQSLGPLFAFAMRTDHFDPDLETDEDTTLSIQPAVLFFPTSAIKLTAAYQIIRDYEGTDDAGMKIDKPNNHLTLQLQGRF